MKNPGSQTSHVLDPPEQAKHLGGHFSHTPALLEFWNPTEQRVQAGSISANGNVLL